MKQKSGTPGTLILEILQFTLDESVTQWKLNLYSVIFQSGAHGEDYTG